MNLNYTNLNKLKTDNVDLILTSKKKPLLLGGKGFLNKKTESTTYYYSLTDLETKGKIFIENKWINVTGKSWMDHQWADTPYASVKWNWFSIQLENNLEIVCYEFIHKDKKIYLANLIDKENNCTHTEKIKLTPVGKFWESKKTGAKYPVEWEIEIPEIKLKLNIKPLIKKQEMIFGNINYLEGPIKVNGNFGEEKVQGKGFMELVGYPMKKSLITQHNDKFKQRWVKRFRKANLTLFSKNF